MDFINPSLPYIMQSLRANEIETKPLIVFYMLGLSISQFFYGTFSDNYGRKKTIILSYIVSIIGIILSIMSSSMAMLYVSRFINGLGNGGATVVARAMLSDICTTPKSLKQGFSYFTIFGMISPTFGPIIGGFIQQYYNNWRLCFVALLFVTIFSAIITQLFMLETHPIPAQKASIIEQGKVYLSLLKLSRFMLYNFSSAIIYVFSIAYYAYMPFILFKLHFSPVETGMVYGVYAVALVFGSLSLAKYFSRFNSNTIFAVCCVSFILNSILFYVYFKFLYSPVALILLTIIIAFTCGISAPLVLSLCMGGFSTDKKGAASAVQSFIKMFFTGIALLLFNFISLQSMVSLLICYIVLSTFIICLFIIDKFVISNEY
ncbi:MAG: drug:H+ antiporter family protein [Burkholderiales bacterium]|nr:drug:H+ antiporter family protein [Burkholderiales bacterium]